MVFLLGPDVLLIWNWEDSFLGFVAFFFFTGRTIHNPTSGQEPKWNSEIPPKQMVNKN